MLRWGISVCRGGGVFKMKLFRITADSEVETVVLIRVSLPERVLFARQLLRRYWQLFETFPEAPVRLCRSRQFLKPASADVLAHFLQNWPQPPIFSKISINLLVPC